MTALPDWLAGLPDADAMRATDAWARQNSDGETRA